MFKRTTFDPFLPNGDPSIVPVFPGESKTANLGGGFGLYVQAEPAATPALTLSGSEVEPQLIAAVWLGAPGSYWIANNTISGSVGISLNGIPAHGNAIYAGAGIEPWDGDSGLLLMNNTFQHAADPAVLLDGASASLVDNIYQGNVVDLAQQACGLLAPPDGYLEAGTLDLCPDYDRLVVPIGFYIYPVSSADY